METTELKNKRTEKFNKWGQYRLEQAEERINKDRTVEIIQGNKQKKKSEDSFSDLWDTIKLTNIHIIRVLKAEKEKGATNLLKEVMDENFPNPGRETNTQIQEAQSTK